MQICQHHCPVAHVAAEFPELCEAETRAFERVLGTYVQRLATIAHGDGVCTTHVPDPPSTSAPRTAPSRSGRTRMMTTAPERVLTQDEQIDALGRYGFGWADSDVAGASAQRGLSEAVVRDISAKKSEPEWMLAAPAQGAVDLRQEADAERGARTCPGIDFDNIKYFVRSTEKQAATWDDLPADIKNTYDKLGIPEAEKQRLVSGVAAQYESEVVYHKIREELERAGRDLPRHRHRPARSTRSCSRSTSAR